MSNREWRLIVGLGNPGPQYEETYHNVGFLILDQLIANLHQSKLNGQSLKSFRYLKTGCRIWIKPICFMNESGQAVLEASKYFKIKPDEILIIHDDSDILFNQHRLSFDRGSAGHHGIQSIINHLNTKAFWRFRIGIRKKINIKSGDFVLKKLNQEDKLALNQQALKIQTIYF